MNLQLNDSSLLIDRILVDGQWLNSGNTFAVNNPATGDVIAQVASAGAEETAAAITAAAAQSSSHSLGPTITLSWKRSAVST